MKKSKLSTRLRAARARLHYTVRDVERLSCNAISNGYYSQLETGAVTNPHPHMLKTLSIILELDYVELLIAAKYLSKREIYAAGFSTLLIHRGNTNEVI